MHESSCLTRVICNQVNSTSILFSQLDLRAHLSLGSAMNIKFQFQII